MAKKTVILNVGDFVLVKEPSVCFFAELVHVEPYVISWGDSKRRVDPSDKNMWGIPKERVSLRDVLGKPMTFEEAKALYNSRKNGV